MRPERKAQVQPKARRDRPAKPYSRMGRREARAQVREALLALLTTYQPLLRQVADDPEEGELPWAM